MPPDERWWSEADRRHRLAAVAAFVIGIALVASLVGAAVALLGPRISTGPRPDARRPVSGRVPTTAPGAESTGSVAPSQTTTSGAVTTAPSPTGVRAAIVAFRRSGAIWVATERGRDTDRVVPSSGGPFALSPDGRTLAVVDEVARTVSLVDVRSRRVTPVGAAVPDRPSWAPDSSRVAFTSQMEDAHDTVVRSVLRRGGPASTLGAGSNPRPLANGTIVAVSGERSARGTPLVVFSPGGSRLVGSGIVVNDVAPVRGGFAYCDAGSPGVQGVSRAPSLGTLRTDGSARRTLVDRPRSSESAFFGRVESSPDGRWLAFAESGDDGYSRLFAVPVRGGTPKQVSTRRDAYLVGWSADGSEILYIDGNGLRGEATRFMAVRRDGTRRRIIIEDAGL